MSILKYSPIIALVALSGCSLITPKVGPQVAKAVNRYCQEPLEERLVLRAQVNGMITPNQVRVTCEGDPQ
jgi:hypothetical protein